ncbi:unnamed protein product [Caenorhabditis brenneri]
MRVSSQMTAVLFCGLRVAVSFSVRNEIVKKAARICPVLIIILAVFVSLPHYLTRGYCIQVFPPYDFGSFYVTSEYFFSYSIFVSNQNVFFTSVTCLTIIVFNLLMIKKLREGKKMMMDLRTPTRNSKNERTLTVTMIILLVPLVFTCLVSIGTLLEGDFWMPALFTQFSSLEPWILDARTHIIALIGSIANWTVALSIQSILKNSFGRLTASQSIGDAIHSTTFAFIFAPMCIFQVNTRILIIFSWACAIFPTFYLYVGNDCKFYYTDDFFAFVFSSTPTCNTIVWYADFLKYNSIVTSIVIVDLITVLKVRKFKSRQACLQAFVFTCELITYFLITPRVDEDQKWLRFGLSTVAWVCVHAVDGIITLTFNEEFSRKLFKGSRIRSTGTATTRIQSPFTINAGTHIQNYII